MLFFLTASTSARTIQLRAIYSQLSAQRWVVRLACKQGQSPSSMPQAMLEAHNVIRARVGVPPLVRSDQLAEMAQDWANHLIAMGGLSHRPKRQHVLGGLRPLHAACVEQNTRCRLRRRRCSSPGDLGVQL